ncbi:hypothetical protein FHETE_4677 [Fusarium heterosporum]|uniref:Uncharacterized protein n=1 Tax=Fusarium heterosporum TaxID=42747 RepID=A0A8H5WTY8_FUSHE|nr:hypothetical protein FHETE_4677 [Fusarium heterosporum]
MRYSYTLSGLLTVAMSSTGFAQVSPQPSTSEATTSGGMNVPTSVSSVITATSSSGPDVVTLTSTLTTMSTAAKPTKSAVPVCQCGTGSCYTPEICSLECTTVYDECCSIEGTDIEVCKKQYTVCLGYSPFESGSYLKPSSCKHEQSYYIEYESHYDSHYFEEKYGSYYESGHYESGHYESGHYESGHSESSYHEGYYTAEYCCAECTTIYDQCCSVPGADIAVCKDSYTVCLGYNPFDVTPYHKPTVCKHEESYYKEYESEHGESYYNSEYDNYGHENYGDVDVEQCCYECTTVYDECCKVAGADIEVCKQEYTICLGYSPFDVVPYVKPTVCKHGDNYGSDNHGDNSYDNHGDNYGSDNHGSDEECCVTCTTAYDSCCQVVGADIEVCKTTYSTCLGYSPFDVTPYVKPTVCKSGSSSDNHGDNYGSDNYGDKTKGDVYGDKTKGSSSSEEECCVQCTTVYDECCSIDGHDLETCKTEYTTCLGYNPFDVTPYVKPTVCKHGDDYSSDNNGDKTKGDNYGDKTKGDNYGDKTKGDNYGDKTKGDNYGDKTKGSSSSSSSSDEECCVTCTTTYKACCDAAGDYIETCKTAYSSCLGYSPFDVTPYVEPTVCKKGGKDDIVIVSGGEQVRPVLALLIIGAVALLC